jgi:putative tryptophan/tyrosine transport system substrate-binding protein
MHERIWMRSANSRSDNRKSKACTELSRSIRNPKWVGLLAIGVTLTVCGAVAQAQQAGKIPRVGVLFIGGRNQPHLESFKQGLKERGYTEGKNILLDYRYAEGKVDRLPSLAAELVQLKVDVIVTTSGNSARAAAETTKTIPIVLTTGADPVRTGLAESLAKPGRNVTGLSLIEEDLSGKRLEILKETFPKMTRMAYLWNPVAVSYSAASGTSGNLSYDQVEKATKTVGVQLLSYKVRTLAEIEKAFADMPKVRPHALLVLQSPVMTLNSKRIVELALEQHLPGMYPSNQFAQEGGLMAYGPVIADLYRRAATYVDKILKGAKPADLPVEQPTKFELVINLKTAKQIGLTIPQSVLYQADKVIK